MRREHRRVHAVTWLILTPVLIAIVLIAARTRVEAPAPDFTAEAQQSVQQSGSER